MSAQGWRAGRLRRAAIGVTASVAIYCAILIVSAPDVAWLSTTNPTRTRYMERRAEQSLARPRIDTLGSWTRIDSMSILLVCAVVKAEDRLFFEHRGFDWAQVKRGIRRSIAGEGVMGGSTITQQLARNLFLGPERTPHRKVREALLTRALESDLSKPRLLELYLNVIEWGDNEWGAQAASRRYFGKDPDQLDAFEASFLAALIAAPRASVRGKNAERVRRIQSRVLVQLHASGLLGPDETWSALARTEASYRQFSRGVAIDVALRESAGRTAAVEGRVRRRYRYLVLGKPAPMAPERSFAGGCGIERDPR